MRPLSRTCGIYLLSSQHLPALQELASAAAVAATTRIPHPYPADGAATFFAQVQKERDEGRSHVFAIEDRKRLVGVVGLQDDVADRGELGFWIGEPFWGRGYATFAVQAVLPYAFDNLRLPQVWAEVLATNAASRRVLAKCGFVEVGERAHGEPQWPADVPLVRCELTPAAWRAHRDAPALAALHQALRAILEAELAAGNEVRETGRGWPDPDSVFVRLRHAFRALPSPLPEGVAYAELNDAHWWKADLTTENPRHTLAY